MTSKQQSWLSPILKNFFLGFVCLSYPTCLPWRPRAWFHVMEIVLPEIVEMTFVLRTLRRILVIFV